MEHDAGAETERLQTTMHCGAADDEGSLFFFGGQSGTEAQNALSMFRTRSRQWQVLHHGEGTAPSPRLLSSMAVAQHKVFVFGGCGEGDVEMNDLWAFEPYAERWVCHSVDQALGSPPARAGHSIATVNEVLFVFGGSAAEEVFGDLWENQVSSAVRSEWRLVQTVGRRPCARTGHTCVVLGTRLFIFGGESKSSDGEGRLENDLWQFDVILREWKCLSAALPDVVTVIPEPRCGHCCCAIGSLLYVFGGSNILGDATGMSGADVWAFDVEQLEWALLLDHTSQMSSEEEDSSTGTMALLPSPPGLCY